MSEEYKILVKLLRTILKSQISRLDSSYERFQKTLQEFEADLESLDFEDLWIIAKILTDQVYLEEGRINMILKFYCGVPAEEVDY